MVLRCLSTTRTDTTDAAAVLELVAAVTIAAVVYVEHRHAIRTSTLLGLYLAIGTLIDGTKSRSYFKRDLTTSGAVAAATCAVRLALVILEEIPKTNLIIDPKLRTLSEGEATSGFFSRLFFLFLQPMMRTGYRGVLAMDDMSNLGIEFAARNLFYSLSGYWPTSRRTSKNSLFLSCCYMFKWSILLIAIPRLLLTGCMFAQPFVMSDVISSIQRPDDDEKGGLVGATVLSFGGAAIFRVTTTHLKNRLVTRARGALMSQVYDKSFRLKTSEAKKQAGITLMSADFENIAAGIPNCIEIPFAIIESGLGMYFLARFIHQSCLVLFAPLIITLAMGYIFGKYSSSAMMYWNEHIQVRVAKTSQVLAQLPAIKCLGLGPKIAQFVQDLRVVETIASRRFRRVHALSTGAAVVVDRMTPVLVVVTGVYTGMFGDTIDAEILYPTLGIVTLVQSPLASLLRIYPSAMSMLGCFERFQKFLCQDEHQDMRTIYRTCPNTSQENEKESSSGIRVTPESSGAQTTFPVFCFEKATLAPRGSDEAVLSNVDFSIENGTVTSMFGPTGSGKTTFAESMLGEAEVLEGKIYVDGTVGAIAVCGQEAYLPNDTVRACIVGACKYEPAWFNTVITYCKLLEDLKRLPNGEHYVIGSGGIALSGGQRQRIGIARAVYARTEAIIFDDVFSALDKRTAIEILSNLCGRGGLLRQLNCTVVLSSYLPECIDVADNLLLFDGNGNISFEKCQSNGKVQKQVACLIRQGFLGEEEDLPVEEAPTLNQLKHEPGPPNAGVQRENDSRRKGSKSLYLLWIDTIGRVSMFVFTLLLFLMALAESFSPIYLRLWIDFAPGNRKFLIGYALISASAGVLSSLCLYSMFIKLAPRASIGLHERLTSVVTRATLGFLSSTDSGSLLNRYSEDMEGLSKRVPAKVYSVLYFSFAVLINIGAILAGATYMSAILPVVFGFLFFIQRYYLRTSRQLRLLEIEAKAPLVRSLRDIGTGIVYIRAFRTQEHDFARCLYILDQSQKPYYFLLASQAFLSLMLDLVVALMALTLSVLALYVKDSTSANAAGLAFLNLITLGTGFNMVINAWTAMEISVGSLARLRNFMRDTPTEKKVGETNLPENWPSRGEVIFQDVVARYKVDDGSQEPDVLRQIELFIEPGKKIGVMGRTGSGKSSLLYAILGFLEYDGTISIDGIDVKTADPDELRSRIITITQELVELDGTVRDNLLPYDKSWGETKPAKLDVDQQAEAERRDQIVRETLIRLRIWDRLPRKGGLDAVLEEVGYSYGEKQLLCIARAVVRRRLTGSKLVLVDEATANVDTWRDQIVREMMVEYFRGCTIIVVAHREETIADTNRTLHMAGGQIEHVDDWDNYQG